VKKRNSAAQILPRELTSQRSLTEPCCSATYAANRCFLPGAAMNCSRSVPSARNTVLRSNRGLLVGDTVRCPWHLACFSLRTGEALRAPALDPVSRWQVEEMHDLARQSTPVETRPGVVYVREKLESADRQPRPMPAGAAGSVTIVGGGAAGNAAAVVERIRL
jgi:nitrite reductase/ring-hydroxylating ferredoxin subunit